MEKYSLCKSFEYQPERQPNQRPSQSHTCPQTCPDVDAGGTKNRESTKWVFFWQNFPGCAAESSVNEQPFQNYQKGTIYVTQSTVAVEKEWYCYLGEGETELSMSCRAGQRVLTHLSDTQQGGDKDNAEGWVKQREDESLRGSICFPSIRSGKSPWFPCALHRSVCFL